MADNAIATGYTTPIIVYGDISGIYKYMQIFRMGAKYLSGGTIKKIGPPM